MTLDSLPQSAQALQAIVDDMNELRQLREDSANNKHYLVVLGADGSAVCTEYADMNELCAELRQLAQSGGNVKVFVFSGRRWHVTRGPLRYLVSPQGGRFPLFQDPTAAEIDETGSLASPPLDGLPTS